MKKRKILLIDDEADILYFVKMNLEATGKYEVVTADSGEKGIAIAIAKQQDFDLIITDYKMKGMDGKKVMDILKHSLVKSPIIIFSIYHDDNSKITESIRKTADGLISKPFTNEKLIEVIEQALKP